MRNVVKGTEEFRHLAAHVDGMASRSTDSSSEIEIRMAFYWVSRLNRITLFATKGFILESLKGSNAS